MTRVRNMSRSVVTRTTTPTGSASHRMAHHTTEARRRDASGGGHHSFRARPGAEQRLGPAANVPRQLQHPIEVCLDPAVLRSLLAQPGRAPPLTLDLRPHVFGKIASVGRPPGPRA